jgi:diaminopropionate ammonia-lyase
MATTFSPDPARVFAFLKQWPIYQPTPVREFKTAHGLLFIKDETARMGLGAFKALGGPFAVSRLLEDRWTEVMNTPVPADGRLRTFAKDITFVCASAGNHGMAVAAGARHAGAKARIHLAATVQQVFADRLAAQGAIVVRSGATYEESVAAATRDAEETNSILLADASWPGYHRPPALVMEGYTVIAEELREHFQARGEWPTDVFVQAGVGGLAGALAHMIRANWRVQPRIVIVEPDAAPCLRDSHRAGKPVTVEGPVSNMGRLDCKEPSLIAFEILKRCDVDYQTVSDTAAAAAQQTFQSDYGITTTPSGAAGLAALLASKSERALVIATEGAVTGAKS